MVPSSLRRTVFQTRPQPFSKGHALAIRQFETTTRRSFPKKNTMDKDSIDTNSSEYSKSGGDSTAAQATDKAAFDPKQTSPEEEHDTASRESRGDSNNPLNVSPANTEVSKPRGQQEGGAQGSADETGKGSDRARTSGGGSPSKAGGDKSGGGAA